MRHSHRLSALLSLQVRLLAVTLCLAAATPASAQETLDLEPDVVLDSSIFKQLMTEGEALANDGAHLEACHTAHSAGVQG